MSDSSRIWTRHVQSKERENLPRRPRKILHSAPSWPANWPVVATRQLSTTVYQEWRCIPFRSPAVIYGISSILQTPKVKDRETQSSSEDICDHVNATSPSTSNFFHCPWVNGQDSTRFSSPLKPKGAERLTPSGPVSPKNHSVWFSYLFYSLAKCCIKKCVWGPRTSLLSAICVASQIT